jgi:hypothetical protein
MAFGQARRRTHTKCNIVHLLISQGSFWRPIVPEDVDGKKFFRPSFLDVNR